MNQKDHYLKEKTKKINELMEDELSGKVMTEFIALRPKTYSHLTDGNNENKKTNGTKKCGVKQI